MFKLSENVSADELHDLVEKYKTINPQEYLRAIINKELPDEIIGYFAYADPIQKVHPYMQQFSLSFLRKKELCFLKEQAKFTFYSAIGACLAAIFSFLSILILK